MKKPEPSDEIGRERSDLWFQALLRSAPCGRRKPFANISELSRKGSLKVCDSTDSWNTWPALADQYNPYKGDQHGAQSNSFRRASHQRA
ncbi:MAG: hypothetical protein WAM82_05230 [Thermoanaerobaculia bacterium]